MVGMGLTIFNQEVAVSQKRREIGQSHS